MTTVLLLPNNIKNNVNNVVCYPGRNDVNIVHDSDHYNHVFSLPSSEQKTATQVHSQQFI